MSSLLVPNKDNFLNVNHNNQVSFHKQMHWEFSFYPYRGTHTTVVNHAVIPWNWGSCICWHHASSSISAETSYYYIIKPTIHCTFYNCYYIWKTVMFSLYASKWIIIIHRPKLSISNFETLIAVKVRMSSKLWLDFVIYSIILSVATGCGVLLDDQSTSDDSPAWFPLVIGSYILLWSS